MTSQLGISKDTIEEFAFHVLNESCTTVTNTAAKTAVQLVFGKANLVGCFVTFLRCHGSEWGFPLHIIVMVMSRDSH